MIAFETKYKNKGKDLSIIVVGDRVSLCRQNITRSHLIVSLLTVKLVDGPYDDITYRQEYNQLSIIFLYFQAYKEIVWHF